MSLLSTYRSFLASPSAASLEGDAAINYIPTLTTVSTPETIERHFTRELKQLKRKSENILHSIESDNALCVEVDTTIEFVAGGGAYLPGLDDNFLSGHTVNLPMIHIVQFSSGHKIQQVRIFWDQGSLLRLVEVIGSRAKNWPVRDGVDAIRQIKKSAGAAPMSSTTPMKQQQQQQQLPNRAKSSSNAMRDPKASLELFKPMNVDEEETLETVRAPRGAARPPTRDYDDLFSHDGDSRDRSQSPSKSRSRAKTGAGQGYSEPRVFSPERRPEVHESPQKPVVEKRYSHFEFSDEPPAAPTNSEITKQRTLNKHQSQWDFEDFATPAKPGVKVRQQDQRNFSWSDDEDTESPPRRETVPQPRRDADHHFEFEDSATPAASKARNQARGVGAMNKDSRLYKNNLYDENGMPGTPRAEGGIANVRDRHKDFDSHWQLTEGTPKLANRGEPAADRRAEMQKPQTTNVDRKGRQRNFDSQFDLQGESPQLAEKSASERNRSQHQQQSAGGQESYRGRGAGAARRAAAKPGWSLTGDADEDEPQSAKKIYKTAGNGMGSRTGARGWGIGDDSAEEEGGY